MEEVDKEKGQLSHYNHAAGGTFVEKPTIHEFSPDKFETKPLGFNPGNTA